MRPRLAAPLVGHLGRHRQSHQGHAHLLFDAEQHPLIQPAFAPEPRQQIERAAPQIKHCGSKSGGKAGSYAVPSSVTSIGSYAFSSCSSLTSVTMLNTINNIGRGAFRYCTNLAGVYFQGNAPTFGSFVLLYANNATVYYLPGTTGWNLTFGGRPTAIWLLQVQTSDASFGVWTNQFGFTISWASGRVIVVEACTNLAKPIWVPVGTNTLTGGSSYFTDP